MPLFSDTESAAPERAAPATVGMVVDELISAAREGRVVYLTGPDDDDAVAVVPVEVAKAGLAALGRGDDDSVTHQI
ncbi:MAG: hypothetical protein GEV03_24595 [Streptosporangiales bacterium]|nr:hypothetical protein [Streptosporangiales bacterium]